VPEGWSSRYALLWREDEFEGASAWLPAITHPVEEVGGVGQPDGVLLAAGGQRVPLTVDQLPTNTIRHKPCLMQ
jgi:hypothetical protein